MVLLGPISKMLISHSHKFIFVKTKKTAGSSIEHYIVHNCFDPQKDLCTGSEQDGTPRIGNFSSGAADGHRTSAEIMIMVGADVWKDYYTFAVERNPWEKVVSEFYWKLNVRDNALLSDEQNFENFVDNTLGKSYAPPTGWPIYTLDNEIIVDEIIQYKDLSNSFTSLFQDKFNINVPEEKFNLTRKKSGKRKKHYTELYQKKKHIDKIANLFSDEIKYFGYKFGD